MLVLTRKTEQKIQIGSDITITILRVKGQAVRVGIEAPKSMRVLRAELPPRELLDVAGEVESELSSMTISADELGQRDRARSAARDRSAAGAMPKLHPEAYRPQTARGTTTPSDSMRAPTPRVSNGLADRVAARNASEKAASGGSFGA